MWHIRSRRAKKYKTNPIYPTAAMTPSNKNMGARFNAFVVEYRPMPCSKWIPICISGADAEGFFLRSALAAVAIASAYEPQA